MKRRVSLAIVFSLFVLFLSACSHTLEVKNLNQYQMPSSPPLAQKTSIGLMCNNTNLAAKKIMDGVRAELSKYCEVVEPYSPGHSRAVDYVTTVDIKEEYDGSGWNFLINFPGFLIFTPAWNGYVYSADYNFGIDIKEGANNQQVSNFTIPVNLNLRHAAINRTWTELSWLEVGAIALIGGIVFISYDDSVTPLLASHIEDPIGTFVGQRILEKVRDYKRVPVPSGATP